MKSPFTTDTAYEILLNQELPKMRAYLREQQMNYSNAFAQLRAVTSDWSDTDGQVFQNKVIALQQATDQHLERFAQLARALMQAAEAYRDTEQAINNQAEVL